MFFSQKSGFEWILFALIVIVAGILVAPHVSLTPPPTQSTSAFPGQCPQPAMSTPDLSTVTGIENVLDTKYGIHVVEEGGTVELSKLAVIYNAMCIQYLSHTYQTLLGATPSNPVEILIGTDPHGCGTGISGMPESSSNYCPDKSLRCSKLNGWCSNNSANTFLLAHEVAHIIRSQNINGIHDAYDTQLINGGIPLLPTFNCQLQGKAELECFSDMVGEYLTYKTYFHDCTLNPGEGGCTPAKATFSNYPTDYAAWYNFAKKNIFDGIEY